MTTTTNIQIGDCRELVHGLDNNSIDCVMTSPPYWGLRDYGHDDQIGLEATPEEYINNVVELFSNIKNKLKDTENCFVNLGDTYSGSGKGVGSVRNKESWTFENRPYITEDVPTKCLCMIPERFAWQMIQTGWILRNKIIWYKPNHMPESVTDRLTKSYEVIYHFVKSQKYYYNLDAIREPYSDASIERITQATVFEQQGGKKQTDLRGNPEHGNGSRCNKMVQSLATKHNENETIGKNPGDVWTINTKPYSEAHFAVYPLELVKRPILAGCPEGGIVLDPFGGSGTTAEFCRHNNRNCITFELNPEYEPLIRERSMSDVPMLDTY